MNQVIANQWVTIAVCIVLYIVSAYAVGKVIGDSTKEESIDLGHDGWHPANEKPVHVGRYYVRFPQSQHEVMADWDGSRWRDITNGLECYFQLVEWKAA